GVRLRYGRSANSRIHVAGNTSLPVATWLMDGVEDPRGNSISITYLRSDEGSGYPGLISYADGRRTVEFAYDDRPDVHHDFAGGIKRVVSKRIREIQVKSYGEIVQRRWFSFVGAPYSTGNYTTARSRLLWTQIFGSDCPTSENPLSPHTGKCVPL